MKKIIVSLLTLLLVSSFVLSGCSKSEDEILMDEITQEFKNEEKRAEKEDKDRAKELKKSINSSSMINNVSLKLQGAYLFNYKNKPILFISILKDSKLESAARHSYETNIYGYNNGSEKKLTISTVPYSAYNIVPYYYDKENLYILELDWDGYEEFKFEMLYKDISAGQSHKVIDSVEFMIKNEDITKTTYEEFCNIRHEQALKSYENSTTYKDFEIQLLDLSKEKISFKVKNNGNFPSESETLKIDCYNKCERPFRLNYIEGKSTRESISIQPLNPGEERVIELTFGELISNNKPVAVSLDEPVVLKFTFDTSYGSEFVLLTNKQL